MYPTLLVLRCVPLDKISGAEAEKMEGCVQHCHRELGDDFAAAIVDRDNYDVCCWLDDCPTSRQSYQQLDFLLALIFC